MQTIFYTIYQITNTINNKIYIGSHKTRKVDDDYMGSGTILKRAFNKHGIENFKKDILFIYNTPEQMYNQEAALVNEDFIARADTYNIKLGGMGGFDYINSMELTTEFKTRRAKAGRKAANANGANLKGSNRHRELLLTDPDYASKYSLSQSNAMKNQPIEVRQRRIDASRTPEAIEKKKRTYQLTKHQQGSNNSNFGNVWMYNLELKQSIRVKSTVIDAYRANGWIKGRKMKF